MGAAGRLGTAAALLCVTLSMTVVADAQMMLPGAVAPSPEGSSQAPAGPRRDKPGAAAEGERVNRGTAVAVPTAVPLVGKTLLLDGKTSQLVLAAGPNKAITIERLTLAGEKISSGRDACKVETAATPIPVTDLGRISGLARYRVEYPACPITFEALDGAVLVAPEPASCDIAQADCRVRIAGLWGPPPGELGPERIKGLERARGGAETAVRNNYRALTVATKDRPTVMGIAKDQAQFSSSREETCRDYAEEGRHNFCATRVTEARAALLHARLDEALAAKAARKGRGGRPR